MQFIHSNLGHRRGGEVVEVTLQGSAANVVLMDSSNFNAFKNGRQHRYYGGLAKRSPVQLRVPHSGNWYAVVYIPAGYQGRVRAGFRVLPGPPPPIRSYAASPLGAIRVAAEEYTDSLSGGDAAEKEYDVFICHAGEDKDTVVRPLALALRARGVGVWFDEFEMRIGDSLRRKIDAGLIASRFGLVVLSPAFFGKGWPNYELDGLVTREVTGGRPLILPIWHEITRADLMKYSPSLADKLARSTTDATIDALADEIAGVVNPPEEEVA